MHLSRSSSYFKLVDHYTADKRRIGLERIIDRGLLPEILDLLDHTDVRLSLSDLHAA